MILLEALTLCLWLGWRSDNSGTAEEWWGAFARREPGAREKEGKKREGEAADVTCLPLEVQYLKG